MFNHPDLNAKLDRVLSDGAVARALQGRIHAQGERIMSTQSDILSALRGSAEASDKARRAIGTLEAENADLTSQLAAAKAQAGETVDPGAVQAAIDASTAAAKALNDAIPAGADHVVGADPAAAGSAASAAVTGTPAAAAAPSASVGAKVVPLAPNPTADAAAVSSAGTPSAGLVGAAVADSAKPAIGAVPTV